MKQGFILLAAFSLTVAACSADSRQAPRQEARVPREFQSVPEVPVTSSVRVILLGDSLARGTGDESGLGLEGILERELRARGIAGSSVNLGMDAARTYHLLAKLREGRTRDQIREADVIVVSIGANDLFVDSRVQRGVTPQAVGEAVRQRLDAILEKLRELNPRARILLIGLYNPFLESSFGPMASRLVQQWNSELRDRYRRSSGVEVIQTFDLLDTPEMLGFDRFHPSAAGYRRIARRIADSVS